MQCAHIVLCRRLTALPGAIPRLGFFATQRNLANLSPEDVDPSQGADSGQGPPPEGPFASVKGALKRVWEEGEGGESPDFGKLPDPQAPGLDWREEMEYSRSVGEVPYSDMQQAGTSLGGNTPQASGKQILLFFFFMLPELVTS